MAIDFEFDGSDDDSLNFLFDDGELGFLFEKPPVTDPPLDFVFGEDDSDLPSLEPVEITADISLPAFTFASVVAQPVLVVGEASLPDMMFASVVEYQTRTERPTVAQVKTRWQTGQRINTETELHWQEAKAIQKAVDSKAEDGAPMRVSTRLHWTEAVKMRRATTTRFEDGLPLRQSTTTRWQEAAAVRQQRRMRFQDGVPMRDARSVRFQDGIKTRNQAKTRWQDGKPLRNSSLMRMAEGVLTIAHFKARFQEAMKAPPGRWIRPPIPPDPGDPCYTPPDGDEVHLLFEDLWDGGTDMVFVCDNHRPGDTVVVPIKRVYFVLNTATLVRVSSGTHIPTLSMSMSLDVDSWTWTFRAEVPGAELPAVEPSSSGEPVEVEATINGVPYRFIVESISRNRTFGKSSLSIGGRGKAALLDSPYAPIMNFGNDAGRTAQQLMNDVLMDNGVPLGWDVEWNLEDWLVPAKVFSHQGSYITALNAIAGAAGAYLQPANVDDQLRVLLRYPTAPWEWSTVTPDYELPSAVTTRESIEWVEKARYNRVWVSGQQAGKNYRVTAPESDGLILAPSVTDPLLTATMAARQRGISILSDTGRIATVGLRLPVLSETGIIPPGKMVRYTDGGVERLGITRSVSVDVGMPAVWQTISVETHE